MGNLRNLGETTVTNQTAKSKVPAVAYALIVVVIVAGFIGYNMTQLNFGKAGLLVKLGLVKTTPVTTYHDLFGSTPIVGGNYSFSPPVTMYRAVTIGLESDGWNASSLNNMTVHVSLNYYIFYTNVTALYQLISKDNITLTGLPDPNLTGAASGFEIINAVTAPVDNYQPQIFNGVSCRYIWAIEVEQNSGMCMPPPGYYLVDAATAQLIPTGPLI